MKKKKEVIIDIVRGLRYEGNSFEGLTLEEIIKYKHQMEEIEMTFYKSKGWI